MRLPVVIAAAAFAGFASSACATEFGAGEASYLGQRAGQVLIYDYEPGVRVRPYWAPPWQHRHYFPTTGTLPEYGRLEDLHAPRIRQRPAETFYREWSTSSAITPELDDFAQAEANPAERDRRDPVLLQPPAGAAVQPRELPAQP